MLTFAKSIVFPKPLDSGLMRAACHASLYAVMRGLSSCMWEEMFIAIVCSVIKCCLPMSIVYRVERNLSTHTVYGGCHECWDWRGGGDASLKPSLLDLVDRHHALSPLKGN